MSTFDRATGEDLAVAVTRMLLDQFESGGTTDWVVEEHAIGGSNWRGYRLSRAQFSVEILHCSDGGRHNYDVRLAEAKQRIGTISSNSARFDDLDIDENPLGSLFHAVAARARLAREAVVTKAAERVMGIE